MGKSSGQKSCKKLSRSARLANHNKATRLHKIANARNRHVKNALQSCGKEFADKLRTYYSANPTALVGRRAGSHLGTQE